MLRLLIALLAFPALAFGQVTFSPVADGTYQALAGATVKDGINVRLSAACTTGPWQFSVDGAAANLEGGCPFDLIGDQALFDTKTLTNGAHTISAKSPASTLTATFTVANGVPQPPGDPAWTGFATYTWTRPTVNVDGTPLTDLAGYRLFYGTSVSALTQTVQIADPATLSYQINGLTAGTWYAAAKSYTTNGNESALGNAVSVVLTAPPVTPTCPASPAVESRAQACVAPLVGNWTQTSAWTAAPPPACWVSTWIPTTAPAGICALPSQLVTAGPLSYESRTTGMSAIGLVVAGLPCGPDTKTVSGVKYCRIVRSQTDLVNFPTTLTLSDVWARAQ